MKKEKKSIRENRKKRMFDGDRLQKRIKTGQQKTSRNFAILTPDKEVPTWKASDGSHIIDIIPYYAGSKDPDAESGDPTYTFEYFVHTNVGPQNKWFICPDMYGKPCPICEYREKLRDNDDEKYKEFFPKKRNLYNIICYDDKKQVKKGVQVWDVSNFYFEKPLMAISKRPSRAGKEEKTIIFAHPKKGKSITFSIEPAKSKNDYPSYVGHSFDDRDYEIDDKVIDSAFTLDEIVTISSYEEIKNVFRGEGGGSDKDSRRSKANKKDHNDEDDIEYDELLEELEDIDDIDDLEEFVDENELDEADFDEDGKLKKEKKKIKKYLEERKEMQNLANEGNTGNDDEGYSQEDIEEMPWVKLKKLIKSEDLDIDIDDFEKDDIDDLREEIIDELGIDD